MKSWYISVPGYKSIEVKQDPKEEPEVRWNFRIETIIQTPE